MITDRELDAQLAGAAGVRDADLPALPEEFLRHVQADDFLGYLMGETHAEPASVVAARQLVADAHEARTAPRRRPRRRLLVRAGVAVVAIAAAWTTAVAVVPADRPGTPDGTTTAPTGGISLVAAEEITFPLSLEPAPEGLTPYFTRRGGDTRYGSGPVVFVANYWSADWHGFTLWLYEEDPRGSDDFSRPQDNPDNDIAETGTVAVEGGRAELVRGSYDGNPFAQLLWERPDGSWVQILGDGAYGNTAAVVAAADSLVDRPQPVGLQFGLAPAGWSVESYEESRSIDVVRDGDPQQWLRLSVIGQQGGVTLDGLVEGMRLVGPATPVTIQGQEGRLAVADGGEQDPDYWYVVGQLPDGPLFLLIGSQLLSQEQVLQIAEQITYTP